MSLFHLMIHLMLHGFLVCATHINVPTRETASIASRKDGFKSSPRWPKNLGRNESVSNYKTFTFDDFEDIVDLSLLPTETHQLFKVVSDYDELQGVDDNHDGREGFGYNWLGVAKDVLDKDVLSIYRLVSISLQTLRNKALC